MPKKRGEKMNLRKIKDSLKNKGVLSTVVAVSSVALITTGFLNNPLFHFAGASAFVFSWIIYYKEKQWCQGAGA
jgi:hypothetical protein